jgi:hypothetical protein
MRFVTLLAFTFPFAIAIPHEHNIRQGDLDKRAGVDVGLRKRFSDAKFTFYEAGMYVISAAGIITSLLRYAIQGCLRAD